MKLQAIPGAPDVFRVVNTTGGPLVADAQSALDLIATARYQQPEASLVLDKADIDEAFFDLKTGIAGEVLQKFVNYQVAVAIVGDFSGYTSKALRDFITESNRGRNVFFVGDVAAAAEKLRKR